MVHKEMEQGLHRKLEAFNRHARRTRIIFLRMIAACAFEVSDVQAKGKIDRAGLYRGTLLVHLHLAKYVGVAACQPPARSQIDELFELADQNHNGWLCKEEFTNAVIVATVPIAKRITVYWGLLTVLPFLVARTLGSATKILETNLKSMPPSLFVKVLAILEFALQLLLSRAFFSILLPNIFSKIDRAARKSALQRSSKQSSTNLWWLGISNKDSLSKSWNNSWADFIRSQNRWLRINRQKEKKGSS